MPQKPLRDSYLTYRNLYLAIIAEMAVVMAVTFAWGKPAIDTPTYFSAYETLCKGNLDPARTPLYPLIIGFCRTIAGDTAGRLIVYALQCALFLYSVSRFRIVAVKTIRNPKIAFLVTAVYGLLPGPLSLNFYLLTESLALSGVTILLWLIVESMAGNIKAAWLTVPMAIGLLMLKPAFIYLPVALLALWVPALLLKKVPVIICVAGLTSALASAGAGCLYAWQMERQTGYRGLSTISLVNTYVTFQKSGFIDMSDVPTPHDDPRTAAEIYGSILRQHKHEAFEYLMLERLPAVCESDALYGSGSAMVAPIRLLTKYVSVNVGATYFLFLLFVAMQARSDIRRHRYSTFRWFLAAAFTGCNIVVILGAPNEWPRLLIPDIPVVLLIAGITLKAVCWYVNETRKVLLPSK